MRRIILDGRRAAAACFCGDITRSSLTPKIRWRGDTAIPYGIDQRCCIRRRAIALTRPGSSCTGFNAGRSSRIAYSMDRAQQRVLPLSLRCRAAALIQDILGK